MATGWDYGNENTKKIVIVGMVIVVVVALVAVGATALLV